MKPFSSLTNRIFFATAFIAVLSIAAAVYVVNKAVTAEAEVELVRGLNEAGTLLEENRSVLVEHFTREARLIADSPMLKAAVDTRDATTIEPIAREHQQLVNADLFVIADRNGRVLARLGTASVPDEWLSRKPADRESLSFWPVQHGILQIVTVPISIDRVAPVVFGTLSMGTSLDEALAHRFKGLTNSEIAFGANGRIHAATLPPDTWAALASDEYDARGQLYRSGFAFQSQSYDAMAPWEDTDAYYDFSSGLYAFTVVTGTYFGVKYMTEPKLQSFWASEALAGAGIR